MHISSIQIKNFKKLKDVTIQLNQDKSVFVGANNSGKTSAFEAISKFLNKSKDEGKTRFNVYDFTIYNWSNINDKLDELLEKKLSEDDSHNYLEKYNDKRKVLEKLFPSMKLVISLEEGELHRVIDLIPRLDSDINQVAVYQRYEPANYEKLLEDYKNAREEAGKKKESLLREYSDKQENVEEVQKSIWPKNFRDFLERGGNLHHYFTIRYYLANPDLPDLEEEEFNYNEVNEYAYDPLKSIIKVDEINAQRGLTDDENNSDFKGNKKISNQFSKYHRQFNGNNKDYSRYDATLEYEKYFAEQTIGSNLKKSLKTLITPLESLGYPAFGSPNINVSPVIDIIKTIEDEGNILFNPHNGSDESILLPENSNGLGFQNLIYIFLKLQYFRRGRLDVNPDEDIQPLHLILIEEPEAHLHAQAQKIFVDKSLEIIQKDQPKELHSQLLLSTHSSHVANESEFNNLLYFKRELDEKNHLADVVHLSDVQMEPRIDYDKTYKKDNKGDKELRNNEENEKFVKKYLEVAEHDLFFADAIILIEGSSERILLPQMLKKHSPYLSSRYITFFEVGGAYGHMFLPWLKALDRPTLIITDIDTVNIDYNKSEKDTTQDKKKSKIHTTTDKNRVTKNPTIVEWFKKESNQGISIEHLLKCEESNKIKGNIRIAYQYINYGKKGNKAYSRTFEDDFALTNMELFKKMKKPTGLAKKYKAAFENIKVVDEALTKELFEKTDSTKTSFALDILFNELRQDEKIKTPGYIKDGFDWLEEQLKKENEQSGDNK